MRKKLNIVLGVLLFLCILSNVLILAEEEWACSEEDCGGGCSMIGNVGEEPCEEEDDCCATCWYETLYHGIYELKCCHQQCPPVI